MKVIHTHLNTKQTVRNLSAKNLFDIPNSFRFDSKDPEYNISPSNQNAKIHKLTQYS